MGMQLRPWKAASLFALVFALLLLTSSAGSCDSIVTYSKKLVLSILFDLPSILASTCTGDGVELVRLTKAPYQCFPIYLALLMLETHPG